MRKPRSYSEMLTGGAQRIDRAAEPLCVTLYGGARRHTLARAYGTGGPSREPEVLDEGSEGSIVSCNKCPPWGEC